MKDLMFYNGVTIDTDEEIENLKDIEIEQRLNQSHLDEQDKK